MELFLFISLWIVSSYSDRCGSGPVCCTGFIWNETVGNCTACKDGFYGVNCSAKCPEMYFGPVCGLKCYCSIDQCHHITGCQQSPSRDQSKTTMLLTHTVPVFKVLKELTTTNITNITTDHHIYARIKTKRFGNSSSWSGMYDASIFLAIVAAVLFALYLVLTLYSKKQIVTQSMQTNNMLCGNALH